jgi:hypothetical protein
MATTIQIKTAIDTANGAKNVNDLKKSIRELNSLALQVGDKSSKGFVELGQASADAQQKLKFLNRDISAFGSSALENINNSLSLTKEGLNNLDFDKVGVGLNDLGNVIKTNPIIFLSGIVIELIQNFDSLKNSGGLVGDTFKVIGAIIEGVEEIVTALGDAIGITGSEAEEASTRIVDSYKRINEQLTITYENQIKLAKAAGKETLDLELEKQQAIIETQKVIAAEILKRIRVDGRLATDEEKKQLKESFDAIRAAIFEGEALRLADNKKKLDEQKKTNDEFLKNEEALRKQIEDIRNSEIQNEFDRNAEILKINAERDQQTIKNTKANEELKAQAALEVQKKLNLDLEANEQNRQAHLNKIVEDAIKEREKIEKESLARLEEEDTKLDTAQDEQNKKEAKAAEDLAKYKRDVAIQAGNEILKFGEFALQQAIAQNQKETQSLLEENEKRLQGRNKSLQSQLDAEEISESDFRRKQLENEKNFQAQEEKIKRDAFEKEKKQRLALIAINLVAELGAIALNAAANPANAVTFGGAGITQLAVLSGLAIGRAAINAAQVRNQTFAKGGILEGASHAEGGIATPFGEMEGGEAVINKAATSRFKPLLSAINSSTGGVRFALGGTTPTQQQIDNLQQQILENSEQPVIKAYVLQSDIADTTKQVQQIEGRNGF